ncbi:hypothetical protein FQN60_003496, partial [Etheostoma spectabile]
MLLKTLVSLCVLAAAAFAVPAQEKRVHHHGDLSERPHDDAQGFQYDHEAFLGKEEAKTFDQLTPEESKDKLAPLLSSVCLRCPLLFSVCPTGHYCPLSVAAVFCLSHWPLLKIVERIDVDGDGYVSHAELHSWIRHRQRRYIQENVDKHWKEYDSNGDGKIAWDEYKNTTYGYYLGEEFDDVDDKATYKSMLTRDERRFRTADRDGDMIATREEFTAFLHPEEYDYMKDVVVQETVEDIDKNADGKINIDEYIGDMFTPEDGEREPDWVTTEKKHFAEFRDANKDGYLDAAEVADWVLPGEVDHADNEAKHLIHETDTDKDGRLTLSELLDNLDSIKSSTITDYGGMRADEHDELATRSRLESSGVKRTVISSFILMARPDMGHNTVLLCSRDKSTHSEHGCRVSSQTAQGETLTGFLIRVGLASGVRQGTQKLGRLRLDEDEEAEEAEDTEDAEDPEDSAAELLPARSQPSGDTVVYLLWYIAVGVRVQQRGIKSAVLAGPEPGLVLRDAQCGQCQPAEPYQ